VFIVPEPEVFDLEVTEPAQAARRRKVPTLAKVLIGGAVGIFCVLFLIGLLAGLADKRRERVEEIQHRIDAANGEWEGMNAKRAAKAGKSAITWFEAGKGEARVGNATLEVTAATKAYTMATDKFGLTHTYNERPHFHIFLRVFNDDEGKVLDYRGFYRRFTPRLSDDFGNIYALHDIPHEFNLFASRRGQRGMGGWAPDGYKIHPKKAITDTLIFEEPIDRAESLKLELPAEPLGGSGQAGFVIPRAFIDG
jgi:hypothetical protein